MIESGISVYTGLKDYNIKDNLNYLHLAKEKGYKYVFSSLHISEANDEKSEMKQIIDECNKLNLRLTLDVSKKVFDLLTDFTGISAFRLDYGFSKEEIVEMSLNKPYFIELNASTVSTAYLDKLISLGLNPKNVHLSFNFYPKKYTGHDLIDVYEKVKQYKMRGFIVSCFIPSHHGFRPPLYEGLPTVESHRTLLLDVVVEELKACGIDIIYFGDAFASNDELDMLILHNTSYLNLIIDSTKITDYKKDFFDNIYSIRPDMNSLLLRLSSPRISEYIEKYNTVKRTKFDVTIDNNLFKRYQGEINIITKDLEQDDRVNVVGKLITTDFILARIKEGQKFKFITRGVEKC